MRNVGTVALFLLGAVFVFAGRADAVSEFCPAQISSWQAVNVVSSAALDQTGPSQVYALDLGASSTRTLNATVVIQTDIGWYQATFAGVQFKRAVESSDAMFPPLSATLYKSPNVYARFPSAVRVMRMWVGSATVFEDGGFGWVGKGRIDCDPRELEAADHSNISPDLPRVDSQFAPAIAMEPPTGLSCAEPFSNAMPAKVVLPRAPLNARGLTDNSTYTVWVEVAIGADGNVADAWVLSNFAEHDPGGPLFAAAALEAARKTQFSPAVALCHAVASVYLFRADFSPDP